MALMFFAHETTSVETNQGFIAFVCYVVLSFLFYFFSHALFIGYIKGNAIKVTEKQFPEVYQSLQKQARKLNLKKIPTLYILQGNGVTNAFATRFSSRNYVVMYSSVIEAALEEKNHAVDFILGHELGHIVRKHTHFFKNFLLFPSNIVPFLNKAWSRSCEYTCDKIGQALCPEGAEQGLKILAAGRHLYQRINVEELIKTSSEEKSFWKWLAEVLSTHPNLSKRIKALRHNLV